MIRQYNEINRDIAPWTLQGGITTAPHKNLPVSRVNVLTHVGLWPRAIKLNPL